LTFNQQAQAFFELQMGHVGLSSLFLQGGGYSFQAQRAELFECL
jgi:hypothetical protein